MRASRLPIAAVVLGTSICAAWPFRHELAPVTAPPAAAIPLELTLRRQDVLLRPSSSTEPSPAVDLEAAIRGPQSQGTAKSQFASLERLAPPPELPVSFQARSEAADPMASSELVSPGGSGSAAKRFTRPRAYRLRDGDTLEKLAERFLGSRERAADIFAANREALARPDLLPVGKEIVIPPKERARDL